MPEASYEAGRDMANRSEHSAREPRLARVSRYRQWHLFITLATALWIRAAVAGAQSHQAADPIDILIVRSRPAAAMDRFIGQLSDLDIRILAPVEAQDADLALLPLRVRELAAERAADVVVWYRQESPETDLLLVYVTETRHGRSVVRRVGAGTRQIGSPTSATLEAAALAVREAVRAIVAEASLEDADGKKAEPAQLTPPPANQVLGAPSTTR